jgi:hypothetical protein
MKIRIVLLLGAISILFDSCGLFRKKCDCPDLRRSKRLAQVGLEEPMLHKEKWLLA